ncbi:5'/3'-nucleotidase SurE [Sediminispirochaeta bajacaliforniensis]|uniref:5'/3'-nucleotidase SurE n=1 Tax=Sediminispirochaeta bajacaliforniensis TaxID=148 RepID=UPI00036B2373|nr:5'/3'-nucleotidase SurE [Sediminispirochaeta bajacaliforniensis]
MRILLSNDDGIASSGLETLRRALSREHEVWVAAPETERSGMSHSITLRDPVRFREVGERIYACSGTPADCVLYSLLGALPEKFDIVVSGINRGPNLGTDIIFSGTAAAARQGALSGVPAVAVSVAPMHPPFPFEAAAEFVRVNLDLFLRLWARDHFININVPNPSRERPYKVLFTHPSKRIYDDTIAAMKGPRGENFYFLAGDTVHAEDEPGSDWAAVNSGNISVSPVFLHPMNHQESELYRSARFEVPDHEQFT